MPKPLRSRSRSLVATLLLFTTVVSSSACSSDASTTPDEGSTFESTTLPEGAGAAVTTSLAPIDPSTIEGGEDAYVEAMTPLIESTTGVADLSEGTAECIATRWVDAIGVDGFAHAGITPDLLGTAQGSLEMVKLDSDQATTMVKAFGKCKVDLVGVAIDQITSGKNEDLRSCLEDELTEELVEKAFVAGITGDLTGAAAAQSAAQRCVEPGD